ncbi:hypothetical protein Csa_024000, partial [Cucumis sativus]
QSPLLIFVRVYDHRSNLTSAVFLNRRRPVKVEVEEPVRVAGRFRRRPHFFNFLPSFSFSSPMSSIPQIFLLFSLLFSLFPSFFSLPHPDPLTIRPFQVNQSPPATIPAFP